MPLSKDSDCVLEFARAYDNYLYKSPKLFRVYLGQTNEHIIPQRDVLHFHQIVSPGAKETNDMRFFVTCTTPIKLLGKYSDAIKQTGDMFLIPSIRTADKHFKFAMPKTCFRSLNYAAIIPLRKSNQITVNLKIRNNEATKYVYKNESLTIQTSLGTRQFILANYYPDFTNCSFEIDSNEPIMIQLVSPLATNCMGKNNCKQDSPTDYTTYFVKHVVEEECDEIMKDDAWSCRSRSHRSKSF
uniref:IgGFc_binding domain-containing protein n=1 Tax=Rhabditophanes sp. KR3021 TaxID=114890 RepID=A0AC35UBK6_9BILA